MEALAKEQAEASLTLRANLIVSGFARSQTASPKKAEVAGHS
jgi:hypothetical protein